MEIYFFLSKPWVSNSVFSEDGLQGLQEKACESGIESKARAHGTLPSMSVSDQDTLLGASLNTDSVHEARVNAEPPSTTVCWDPARLD